MECKNNERKIKKLHWEKGNIFAGGHIDENVVIIKEGWGQG